MTKSARKMIKYNKCTISQNTADGICNVTTNLNGGLGGADELSHGIVCIMAQRYADAECELEKKLIKSKSKLSAKKNIIICDNNVKRSEQIDNIFNTNMFEFKKSNISVSKKQPSKYLKQKDNFTNCKMQTNKQCGVLHQQLLINDRLTTESIVKTTIQYLEPIKRSIIDEMFNKSGKIKIIDNVVLKHPVTNQMYILEIPNDVKKMIISINGLTAHGYLICQWLKNNKMMTMNYYENYKEFNNEFEKSNKKCKYLLEDNSSIDTFTRRGGTCKSSYPINYFNAGNSTGYSKNVKLGEGISLNYSVSGGSGGSGGSRGSGGSVKMGGWEVVGMALLTVTIKIGAGGGIGLCVIM